MVGKRKRSKLGVAEDSIKRLKLGNQGSNGNAVKRSLLSQYYHRVVTLRDYLLLKLPPSSKVRRIKLTSVGYTQPRSKLAGAVDEGILAQYLDQTLIGILDINTSPEDERLKEWACFSQLAEKSRSTFGDVVDGGLCQSEIVDFAIWSIFTKAEKSGSRVQHLLCQGFRKLASAHPVTVGASSISVIPGLISAYSNHLITSIKSPPWPKILKLLGKEGERVMIDLILDCGIFQSMKSGQGNYLQLSGKPLGDLPIVGAEMPKLSALNKNGAAIGEASATAHTKNAPGSIVFVRNRILYARAALNAVGEIKFGLRHIHVLNRYPYESPKNPSMQSRGAAQREDSMDRENRRRTVRVLMYMFPREFGLHNVHTSAVDSRETSQPFKDYTLRDDEIRSKYGDGKSAKVPKRLRREAIELTKKLQISHGRCAYAELLNYYCPLESFPAKPRKNVSQQFIMNESTSFESQVDISINENIKPHLTTSSPPLVLSRKPSLTDHAVSTAEVSSFCRAALSRIIPDRFWGSVASQKHNKAVFMRNIDKFVGLRRFESLSLHEVTRGIKLEDVSWLAPRNDTSMKMSQSDSKKRLELLSEFLYYLFDSILIPLIRTNFHVTESSVHGSRLFFFRHDVWRALSEPALSSLKLRMFEELSTDKAESTLASRGFGFSYVRLLPKQTGIRPVMNLKRRAVSKGFKTTLGPSINSVLSPVFNMLTLEKQMHPHRLGSALFSVGDIYSKLRKFKSQMPKDKQLYFVKTDVQAAFDTIPQSAVMGLMSGIPRQSKYRISKHVEIKPANMRNGTSKPIRKWISIAAPADGLETFDQGLETNLAAGKKNTVFVESIQSQLREKDELLGLLDEHIQCNMIKIGKKFYRQKEGIPQGSVVSSLLCNYFYADLEFQHLAFLNPEDSLLLRLIDDFLLITTNRQHAKTFLQVLHGSLPEYGVSVNTEKTLTNFEATVNGQKLARLVGNTQFPYCGTFIDTKTLDIMKDRDRKKYMTVADSLTVEFSREPGSTFQRKVLNTFKIQAHAMFLDTSFNSLESVFSNLYENLKETATKMWRYVKCLPLEKQPRATLVIETITSLLNLADVLLRSKGKNNEGYGCTVSKTQIEWIVMLAFRDVLIRKQSRYGVVIAWLNRRILEIKTRKLKNCAFLRKIGS